MPQATKNALKPTQLQQGMLYSSLRAGHGETNVLQAVVEVSANTAAEVSDRIEAFCSQVDLLRTVWRPLEGGQSEFTVDPAAAVSLSTLDLSSDADFRTFLQEDREKGFAPSDGPLWRVAVVTVSDSRFLVLTVHTALADRPTAAWLMAGLVRGADSVVLEDQETGLGPLVELFQERGQADDLEYWQGVMSDFEGPTPCPGAVGEDSRGRSATVVLRSTVLSSNGETHPSGPSRVAQYEAAASLLLAYYSNSRSTLFGSVKDLRETSKPNAVTGHPPLLLGPAVAPLPVVWTHAGETIGEVRTAHEEAHRCALEHAFVAPLDLMAAAEFGVGRELFQFVLLVEAEGLAGRLGDLGGDPPSEAWFEDSPPYSMMLYVAEGSDGLELRLRFDPAQLSEPDASLVLVRYERVLQALQDTPHLRVDELHLLRSDDADWSESHAFGTLVDTDSLPLVHESIAQVAMKEPARVALVEGGRSLSYEELDRNANRVANLLIGKGVRPGEIVGLAIDRSIETVVGMLGIMKAGGSYLPMDPAYPEDRLQYMLSDSGASVVLCTSDGLEGVDLSEVEVVELNGSEVKEVADSDPEVSRDQTDLAYLMYTSGSTGRPKGVMIEHGNVLNFFAGMDGRVPASQSPGVWLAVTSVSFDISVLELLWTLSRGFKVVLFDPTAHAGAGIGRQAAPANIPLGLFYFAADEGISGSNPYRLLMDGARFADANGFTSIWTPERHFHAFGGLYPNPAVTGAAVAAITDNVRIRAGSVVLPLHHPARVAEEWSVVDNLSGGRVGLAFASGWHPNDFVLRPEGYEQRKVGLFEWADEVQRLWRGEALDYPGPDGTPVSVSTLPRPRQAHLPVWITAAGSPETVRQAGLAGHFLLTHLLGQTVEELADRIRIYREARREGGHDGPGKIAVMLHTFVGENDDEVREEVRGPMVAYLRSSAALVKNHLSAWEAFSKRATKAAGPEGDEFGRLSEADMDSLLNFSFERYYETSALLGSRERGAELLNRVLSAGATEIACLVDFGVDEDRVIECLPVLREVGSTAAPAETRPLDASVSTFARLIEEHGVTHFQCTPSLARLLLADASNEAAFGSLTAILIGGEAFTNALSKKLKKVTEATLLNMYGPTEATVWSSTREVRGNEAWGSIPIGEPLSNLTYFVADHLGRPLPVCGSPGELIIAGESLARGYWNREELTGERFPTLGWSGQRGYRTGDLVQFTKGGELLFLGRLDHQVKIRGHRIELGEIESVLSDHPAVSDSAVTVSSPGGGESRLTGHFVALEDVQLDELKRWARERLPEVMVPTHWERRSSLPKTPNLKVDRIALAALPSDSGSAPESAGPTRSKSSAEDPKRAENSKSVEVLVLGIWKDELGMDDIGLDDNFFDIGGHSLLVVQVHLRLKSELGRELPITHLFQHPTVRSLAGALAGGEVKASGPANKRAALRKRMRRGRTT